MVFFLSFPFYLLFFHRWSVEWNARMMSGKGTKNRMADIKRADPFVAEYSLDLALRERERERVWEGEGERANCEIVYGGAEQAPAVQLKLDRG